jgi:hypothetical protein
MDAFVAPWQNINPLQYLEAAKAGAALGQQIKSDAQQNAARMAGIAASIQNAAAENARATAMAQMEDRREREQAAMALEESRRQSLMRNELESRNLDLESRALDLKQSGVDAKSPFKGVSPTSLDAAKILEESFKRTNALPVNAEGKPERVFANPELAAKANEELTGLISGGMAPAEATAEIRKKYAGMNLSPNIVTNSPGKPGEKDKWLWFDKAAVPPKLSTNGYVINAQPQGAAQGLTQPQAQTKQTVALTPKQKADKANQIAAQNPTLSREEILALVNKL